MLNRAPTSGKFALDLKGFGGAEPPREGLGHVLEGDG